MKSNIRFEKLKECAGWLLCIILIFVAAWYISAYHYQLMMIQGDSMSPSFRHLQLVVLDKHPEDFCYGDVVAFQCDGLETVLIKRVAACPGDTVLIHGGTLYVNGEVSTVFPTGNVFAYSGIADEGVCLDEYSYFVIGDNIAESKDSRYKSVGTIQAEKIIGKVLE